MKPRDIPRHRLLLWLGYVCVLVPACHSLGSDRLIYNEQGIRVGIEADPTVSRSAPPGANAHPANIDPQEVRAFLELFQVSGWSGTLVGFLDPPRPFSLFDNADLHAVTMPIAEAFRKAGPRERVFFSIASKTSPYGDATAGSLFLRDSYLHVVVTDHKAISRSDTAGGDEKDPRDTKGMKLWVAAPYKAAIVPDRQVPQWAPFETVHISRDLKEMVAFRKKGLKGIAGKQADRETHARSESSEQPPSQPHADSTTVQDLQLQIRELTRSNLDLRDRTEEQTRQMKELKDELVRLQRELDRTKSKTPATRKAPSP